jgi:hypothetical protein
MGTDGGLPGLWGMLHSRLRGEAVGVFNANGQVVKTRLSPRNGSVNIAALIVVNLQSRTAGTFVNILSHGLRKGVNV